VFAVIGNVGTPTAKETVPYALEKKLLFFAPFTGAKLLRNDPPDRYVFNFRASYAEETAATVHFLVRNRKVQPDQIAVFAQADAYGDSGFDGAAKALAKIAAEKGQDFDKSKVLRVGYARNTVDVEEAVQEVLKHRDQVKAVVMVPAYKPAAKFIQRLKDEKMNVTFTSVSFVGSEALAEELKQLGPAYCEGVVVTQVVPHPESGATAVLKYREALKKHFPDEKPSFISLEGYLAAGLLAEGMQRCGDDLTTDRLIDELEKIKDLDLGVGAPITFTKSEHQGSHKVWGTVLDKTGRYQILDLD
jgi:branched-chain amino acid transport system substrate-binding protein